MSEETDIILDGRIIFRVSKDIFDELFKFYQLGLSEKDIAFGCMMAIKNFAVFQDKMRSGLSAKEALDKMVEESK